MSKARDLADGTFDTDTLVVDAANNRVGVGTAAPSAPLQIQGAAGEVRIQRPTATQADWSLKLPSSGGELTFYDNNNTAERMRIDGSGNVKISNGVLYLDDNGSHNGIINAPASLFINIDSDSTAVGEDFVIGTNRTATTGGSELLRVDDEGRFFCTGIYAGTTGSGANVTVASSGRLERSTSSLRYKNTINDATHGLTELLTLRPVTYKGNNDGDTVFGGLIAEEVHDAGLTEFVQYDEEDRPDALSYGNMVSLCIKAIQELNAKVDACETKNTEQQAIIEDLQTRVAALETP